MNSIKKLTNIKHYRKEYVKALYGRHGRSSGLNPGIMWPRKDELEHLKMFEKHFHPTLESLIKESDEEKQLRLETRRKREEEVYNNLLKLPAELKKFNDKIDAKTQEKQAWLEEREARIEEVRQVLGYRAKPTDEKFIEALAQKEQEDLKAKKKELRKKRESMGLDEMLDAIKSKEKTET